MYLNDIRIPNEKAFLSETAVSKLRDLDLEFDAKMVETFYEVSMPDIFRTGTHVLFTVPAAYSPQCSALHLPGYVKDADKFKELGVDALWCMAVNDPFVMDRWLKGSDPSGEKVFWISDSSADVSRSMNLAICMAGIGFGTRSRRAALLIENGRILHVSLEPPAEFYISSSEYMLKVVKAYLK
jgi:peroxiredoxin